MEPYARHVFLCMGSSCSEGDPAALRKLLHQVLLERLGPEYEKRVRVTKCLCLAQCTFGPNMVVYPEGVWYGGLKPAHIRPIVEEHLIGGQPVERFVRFRMAPPTA